MMGCISDVSKFFQHGKRQDKLESVIEENFKECKKKRVKPLCRTRWIERHDALEVFIELYPAIVLSLSDIAVKWNRETVKDATGLLVAIERFPFLIILIVVFNVMSYIKGLTVLLQLRSLDIVKAMDMVEDVQAQLADIRGKVDHFHKTWFQSAVDMTKEVGVEKPSISRRCARQTARDNVEATTPEEYYRRTLTVPFLDHLIAQLQQRFATVYSTCSKIIFRLILGAIKFEFHGQQ